MSLSMLQVAVPASSSSPGAPGQYAVDDAFFYGYGLTGWRRVAWSAFGPLGTAYYVATTGSDSNPGTLAQPFATLKKAIPLLKPGDVLYLRGGTYAQTIDSTAFSVPSGFSWGAPVTIAGYPGEIAILMPPAGNQHAIYLNGPHQYIVFDHLVLDGTNLLPAQGGVFCLDSTAAGAPNFICLSNSEVRKGPAGANSNGVIVASSNTSQVPTGNQFLNVVSHDNGSAGDPAPYTHGFYITGNRTLIQGCQAYNNSGHGIQVYKSGFSGTAALASNNVVTGCQVHDNGKALALGASHNGIELDTGANNLACNNLVWNSGRGIQVNYGAVNAQVYNNTLYNCLDSRDGAISIGFGGGANGTLVRNNILYGSRGQDILNYGNGTVSDHNLLSSIDPLFVNAAVHDFHLQAGSPALDAGVTLAVVTTDFDGKVRPQGSNYDLGAYER